MKNIEDKMIAVFWDDGIIDTMAALSLIGIGLFWIAGLLPIGAALPAIFAVLWEPIHVKFILPRMGNVKFKPSQEKKWKLSLVAMVTTGLGAMILVIILVIMNSLAKGHWIPALPSIIVSALFAAGAFLTKLHRFYLYSLLLLFSGIVAAIFSLDPGVCFVASGTLVLVPAIVFLVRFLKKTSINIEEDNV